MGQYDWIIGVTFSLASSFFSCVGLIFQKWAHVQNEKLPPERRWPTVLGITCSPCWWASFIMMGLVPFPFDFFAFSFAAQSIVAPFAGLTLVMNQFLAPVILKEKLYRMDIFASIVVLVGCSITTASGNHKDMTYTLDSLLALYKTSLFIAAFSVVMLVAVAMIVSLKITEPAVQDKRKADEEGGVRPSVAPIVGMPSVVSKHTIDISQPLGPDSNRDKLEDSPNSFASGRNKGNSSGGTRKPSTPSAASFQASTPAEGHQFSIPVPTTKRTISCLEKARPFFYAFVAGAFGSIQNIFFKAVAVLMKASAIDGPPDCWVSALNASRFYNESGSCLELTAAKDKCVEIVDCYGVTIKQACSVQWCNKVDCGLGYTTTQGLTDNVNSSSWSDGNKWEYSLDRSCLTQENSWATFYPYLFIVICLFFAVSQLSYLNKGMAHFKAVLVFPLYNTCFLTLSVLMGAAYYQEFRTFKNWQLVAFPLGLCVTISGVVLFIFTPRDPEEKSIIDDDEGHLETRFSGNELHLDEVLITNQPPDAAELSEKELHRKDKKKRQKKTNKKKIKKIKKI